MASQVIRRPQGGNIPIADNPIFDRTGWAMAPDEKNVWWPILRRFVETDAMGNPLDLVELFKLREPVDG